MAKTCLLGQFCWTGGWLGGIKSGAPGKELLEGLKQRLSELKTADRGQQGLDLFHVLCSVWANQNRYDGHVHDRPLLAHRSAPQGCPFAPAVLFLWLAAGIKFVEAYAGKFSDRQLAIYVDDRSFTTPSWPHAERQIKLWKGWSTAVGLLEYTAKIQIAVLRNNKRLRDARAHVAILSSALLHWSRMLKAWKSLIISKASYGWISDPLQSETQTASSICFLQGCGRLRMPLLTSDEFSMVLPPIGCVSM